MIHLIIGRQGSGKTLLLVWFAYQAYLRGRNIYANVHLHFKNNPLNYMDIIDCKLQNGAVLLDEIHQLLPARRSMSKRSIAICDNFLSMVRKQGLEVYGTTQTLRKVDVRFREEADYVYVCEKYILKGGSWVKWLHNENLPMSTKVMIKVQVTETWSNSRLIFNFLANPYFKMFDTNEIIKVTGLDDYGKEKKPKAKEDD